MVAEKTVEPKWLIDTYGILLALQSRSNSLRVFISEAIISGQMLFIRQAGDDIKDLYPDFWDDFKSLGRKKYVDVTVRAKHMAGILMEQYGASRMGSIPTKDKFQNLALAQSLGCTLVSSGKGLSDCAAVAHKCGLPADCVISIEALS
jgi:hypothetical protein